MSKQVKAVFILIAATIMFIILHVFFRLPRAEVFLCIGGYSIGYITALYKEPIEL